MKIRLLQCILCVLIAKFTSASIPYPNCGCRMPRDCYKRMIEELWTNNTESPCVESSAVGSITVEIYTQALMVFCGDVFVVTDSDYRTYDGSSLFEVTMSTNLNEESKNEERPATTTDKNRPLKPIDERPIILIDAGQNGGTSAVKFTMWLMQHLLCKENEDMLDEVMWVILPNTNPDGMEFGRVWKRLWRKNTSVDSCKPASWGVDITRNFASHFDDCDVPGPVSNMYPGPSAKSENETKFITEVINKYAKRTKLYLSLRSNGHSLLYPHGYTPKQPARQFQLINNISSSVAHKVNAKAGAVTMFMVESIYRGNDGPTCGSSVDYAYDQDIDLAFEMRMFPEEDVKYISMFHSMPNSFDETLTTGYWAGIKEFYFTVRNFGRKKSKRPSSCD